MPYAAPYPCPRHPNILVQRGERCPKCPVHKWGGRNRKKEKIYDHSWKKIRAIALIRDDYLCQPCLREGRLTVAAEVDHIIPISKDGTHDLSNLQAICKKCHKKKTALEAR